MNRRQQLSNRNPDRCIYVGCTHRATLHAYSTVGAGDIHACEHCAPNWLKSGDLTPFYTRAKAGASDAETSH